MRQFTRTNAAVQGLNPLPAPRTIALLFEPVGYLLLDFIRPRTYCGLPHIGNASRRRRDKISCQGTALRFASSYPSICMPINSALSPRHFIWIALILDALFCRSLQMPSMPCLSSPRSPSIAANAVATWSGIKLSSHGPRGIHAL